MLWDETFVARLEETERDVTGLVLKIPDVLYQDRTAKSDWESLGRAVVDLNSTLTAFVDSVLTGVFTKTASVHANHQSMRDVMANMAAMLTSGFKLLQLAMRRDLDRTKGRRLLFVL